jgi:hypothetical protein
MDRSSSHSDFFIGHEAVAQVGGCDEWAALVKIDGEGMHIANYFRGATRVEAQRIADAINAAISGAKSRALEAAIAAAAEPVAAAAE